MKCLLAALNMALLMAGCGGSDIPKESEEASFNASVMAKCEACGEHLDSADSRAELADHGDA